MFQAHELLATPSDSAPLIHAQFLLIHSIKCRLPNAIWVSRGSISYGEALCTDYTDELDLDIFLVIPNKGAASSFCTTISEAISIVCARERWSYEARPMGYRVMIQDIPKLTIDIGVLRRDRLATERLSLCGQADGETDVLVPNLAHSDVFVGACRTAWMNMKLWAKTRLPWEANPGTYTLRSMFFLHAKSKVDQPIQAGWRGYIQLVKSFCDYAESGDLIRSRERLEQLSSPIANTIPLFIEMLRIYVSSLEHMTLQEHRDFISNRTINRPLQVFVSSRQREFHKLRLNIASNSPRGIHFLLAENFFPWESQTTNGIGVCEEVVESADVFVGIYGKGYGINSPNRSGSPIEEELKRAKKRMPSKNILLFSQAGSTAEPKLAKFLERNADIGIHPLFEDINAATTQLVSRLKQLEVNIQEERRCI